MKNVLLQKVNRLVPILLLLIFCLFFLTSCSQQKETFVWKNFESTSLDVSFQYPENVFSVIEFSEQRRLFLVENKFANNYSAATSDSRTINIAKTQLTNRSFDNFSETFKQTSLGNNLKLESENNVKVSEYPAVHRVWSTKWSSNEELNQMKIFTDQYLINIGNKEVLVIMGRSVANGTYQSTYFKDLVKSFIITE